VNAAVVHGKFMSLSGGEKQRFEREGRMPKLGFAAEQRRVAEKSASLAACDAMGVELRAGPRGLESPSAPGEALVVMKAGQRASAKVLESPPDPTATRAARLAVTPGVMGQKSADGIVAKRPP